VRSTPTLGRVSEIAGRLAEQYGSPRLNNKDDPLDELIFILLSAKTAERSYVQTYDALHASFPDWFGILGSPIGVVRHKIARGGLATKKERQLRSLLQQLQQVGATDLRAFLEPLKSQVAEQFLESLPGIGRKSAKCVLMYSMDREVFPVDTHVARAFDRLGWFRRRRLTDSVLDKMERLVPPGLRYGLHVNLVAHGRLTCTAWRPNCPSCPVQSLCPFPRSSSRRAASARNRPRRTPGSSGRSRRTAPLRRGAGRAEEPRSGD
jgi:endonuclease III